MKCVTDVVETSASVSIDPHRAKIVMPDDFADPPEGGLNIRWPDPPLGRKRACSTTSGTPPSPMCARTNSTAS